MKELYTKLLVLLTLALCALPGASFGQSCSSLQFTAVSFESRCTSTGSIAVSASGGSGSYNYKATGPLTTPFTSASTITGLRPGIYTVFVKDINTGCETSQLNIEVLGTYSDPRFGLAKTNVSCRGNDGSVSVNSQEFGRAPFTYSIIAPSTAGTGTTNSSGTFANLVAGEYFIQLRDSCGGIQVRRVTVEEYIWYFDAVSVTKVGCDSADAVITIKDNRGNSNTSGTAFSGFTYGVVRAAGDTSWYPGSSFRFFLGKRRSVTIIAKDNCGNMHAYAWTLPPSLIPSVGNVNQLNLACSTFTADVTGEQNLTAPEYCIYSSSNVLLDCNYTGFFSGLPYGNYCIRITDVCYDTTISRCFTASRPVPAVGSTIAISNQVCSTFTATVTGQANLTAPQYCLFNNANVQVACNTTGIFTGLAYGAYCIKTDDNCVDTIITRCFTVTKPAPVLNVPVISGSTCNTFNVNNSGTGLTNPVYCLYNALGVLISCDSAGTFTSIPHGNYCVKVISCGDTATRCFSTSPPVPSVASNVQTSNKTCTSFTATVTGQANLTAPQYCLLDSLNATIACNTNGIFPNVPYGRYCITIKDSCSDSTITRCFKETRNLPVFTGSLQQLNSACSTFTANALATYLTSPKFCLYDSLDNLVACNNSGAFFLLPYGRYCMKLIDGCGDTLTTCRTFAPLKGMTLSTSKSCAIGNANMNVQFLSGNAPYTVQVSHPNGTVVYSTTSSSNPVQFLLPALPPGASYKFRGTDQCGQTDTGSIAPDASIVTKSITAISKCPSSEWANGSGDLSVTCSSNLYTIQPLIISKNGVAYTGNYSSNNGNTYLFTELEPATYVVEYTVSTCNTKLYDTFAIQPYRYPTQGQSAIYQCDDNSFSLGANVSGGVSPYAYQIIGSMPETPSIISATQTNPIFTINTGTTYSLVRLRTVDACGNATLSDLSILPLQNISVTASNLCYYDTATLSVDTIPNATYAWYKRRDATDSTLVSTTPQYLIPFFEPEHTAMYVCKVTVNNGCLIRLAYFNVAENCNNQVLPAATKLEAVVADNFNQLTWRSAGDLPIDRYGVEYKPEGAVNYRTLATMAGNKGNGATYEFRDGDAAGGTNQYRLKLYYTNGRTAFSNVVRVHNDAYRTSVYPNPAGDVVYISIRGNAVADYDVTLTGTGGQVVFRTVFKNIRNTTVPYTRSGLAPGLYLLQVKNQTTGQKVFRKVIFR